MKDFETTPFSNTPAETVLYGDPFEDRRLDVLGDTTSDADGP